MPTRVLPYSPQHHLLPHLPMFSSSKTKRISCLNQTVCFVTTWEFSPINCDWAGLSFLAGFPFVARQELFLSALCIQRKLRLFHVGFLLGFRCILLWKSLALSFPFCLQSVLNATFFSQLSAPISHLESSTQPLSCILSQNNNIRALQVLTI